MREIPIENWEVFEAELQKLYNEIATFPENARKFSQLLFRGQLDAKLKLETTLDRYVDPKMSLTEYYLAIFTAKPQIETFTGQTWKIPLPEDYDFAVNRLDMNFLDRHYLPESPQIYEYMAYLRHHGFPSPLLDWTSSPYLAAFFAYNNAKTKTDNIAIYAYFEYGTEVKSTGGNEPWIRPLGPYIKTHRRHFLQQSNYTTCKVIDNTDKTFYYAKHEDVFAKNEKSQDVLWKFILPVEDRLVALRTLESMNINAYSLFGSEESLMSTMALRAFKLK